MAPSKVRLKYSEEAMDAACESVKTGRSMRDSARTYGVPYHTLRGRLNGRPSLRKQRKTVLHPTEESRLAEWLGESSRRGFGRTKAQLLKAVQNVLIDTKRETPFRDNKPGEKWYRLFRARKKEISTRVPQALGSQRAGVTESKIVNWFQYARYEIDSVDPDVLSHPNRIFNCDESGFQLGGGTVRVLAPRSDKRVYQVTNDTHKQITVLVCGNAAGEMLNPLLIFPGQRFSYDPMEGFEEAHLGRSTNGWIDSEIFEKWFEKGFCQEISHLQKPVVLFADGHKTHLTLRIHELCTEHGVIMYQLPSHASHIVQPLDLTSFKNLKQAWREEVMDYQEQNSDTLSKRDFAKVFKKAWDRRAHDREVLVHGFRAAGIFPWDPQRFDRDKVVPSRMFEEHQSVDCQTGQTDETDSPTEEDAETRQTTEHVEEQLTEKEEVGAGQTGQRRTSAATTESTDDSTNVEVEITGHTMELTLTDKEPDGELEQRPTSAASASSTDDMPIVTEMETKEHTNEQLGLLSTSTGNNTDDMPLMTALDRLLHLTARAGSERLVHYMACFDIQKTTDEPEQQLFSSLYATFSRAVKNIQTSDDSDRQSNNSRQSFDNLPLPVRWSRKKRTVIEPPKMVSSEEFRIFKENVEKKKKDENEEKEKKKKEREEKRLKCQEEKEQKKKERETKKREKERKQNEEKERRRKDKERKEHEARARRYKSNQVDKNKRTDTD